jgi:hypothetical protein
MRASVFLRWQISGENGRFRGQNGRKRKICVFEEEARGAKKRKNGRKRKISAFLGEKANENNTPKKVIDPQ